MNLHIMQDEKVISRTIDYFNEALPGENIYIVLLPNSDYQCIHVKHKETNVHKVVYGSKAFWQAVGNISQYKYIILHFLNTDKIRFVRRIKHPGITWIIWGGDLYFGLLKRRGYYLFSDKRDDLSPYRGMNFINAFFAYFRKQIVDKWRIQILNKISYVCADKGDFELLYQYYPEYSHIVKKDFFYYPVDDIMHNINVPSTLGDNVVVGNSAAATGNHREAFQLLIKAGLRDRKVIVPLSYGANKKQIMDAGYNILKEHFVPIEDFLPLDKYNELLCSARTFVYDNYRQEATGNIVIALYIGATLFLNDRNPMLKNYLDMGFIMFSTSQLKEKIEYRLTQEEKKHNKELVDYYYSRERLLHIIKESFG